MKNIRNNKGLTLTEASLVMLVMGLIVASSLWIYKNHISSSQYVSVASTNMIDAIRRIEETPGYNNGGYYAVNINDITDLSQDLSNNGNIKVVSIWAALTDANTKIAEKYRGWDYDCVSTGTTVRLIAKFNDIPKTILLYEIAKNVKDYFPSWDCSNVSETNKTITCQKTNIICR
jgi:Tfp pilus assembly protein PilE